MFKARYKKYTLNFNEPGGTSRGVLREKDSFFLFLAKEGENATGIGEFSILPQLSPEAKSDPEAMIGEVCNDLSSCKTDDDIENILSNLVEKPALRFAVEMAHLDLKNGGNRMLFPGDFSSGKNSIPINGLVWMGDIDVMRKRAEEKISEGFDCIKLKVGAREFEDELKLLKDIREKNGEDLIIRFDGNGAFNYADYYSKLKRLSELNIHSIEQPIPAGHAEHMEDVCTTAPLPVALDEELIGYYGPKPDFLRQLKPDFLILKPSLMGGFKASEEWIVAAKQLHIDWWVTSALESNIGLNAIAQWTYNLGVNTHQGLGTGNVFSNNINSPLFVEKGHLHYRHDGQWDLSPILD